MGSSDKFRILAVDDLQDNLELIREVFEDEPYELVTANTAEQALALALVDPPDAAILDVQMPGVDGYELCRRLREAVTTRRVPIVFLTAHRLAGADAVRGLDLGACDYVTKPFEAEELRARVRAILRVAGEHEQAEAGLRTEAAELKHNVHDLEEAKLALEVALAKNARLVAELQHAKALLDQKNRRLLELYETAHQFVDHVSHEFRTPLTVIKEFTSIVRDGLAGEINDAQREHLDLVSNRVDDLGLMIDGMLDLSRLEAGVLGVCRGICRVEDIVEHVRPMLVRKASASQVTLDVCVEPGLPDVYADPEQIGRVIVNLAVNALKFCGEGGHVELWTRNDPDNARVVIGVTDDGAGIAEEDLEIIFERFRQVGGTVRSSTKGFGLGLNIAKELVHLNFGQITVQSQRGAGSTFSFTVPTADPPRLLRRYLDRIERTRGASSFVSALSVGVDEGTGATTAEEVEEFLQHHLYPDDLLLRTRATRWMLVTPRGSHELDGMVDGLRHAQLETDRNRVGEPLPAVDYDVVGTWPVDEQGPECLRRLEVELQSAEPTHA